MKVIRQAAWLLVAGLLASVATAQENNPDLANFQRVLNSWPYGSPIRDMPLHEGGYHPDHPVFCKTCYGGAECGRDATCPRCGPCAGDTCERGKVADTCRRCGLFGRILFYECRRLNCGEVGGPGCKNGGPMDVCINGEARKIRPNGFARWLTGEGERVFWIGNKPDYTLRFNCYTEAGKHYEGARTYYGFCCGCYEAYLQGNYDSRGPLNLAPWDTSKCQEEDSITGGCYGNRPHGGRGACCGKNQAVELPAVEAEPIEEAAPSPSSAPEAPAEPTAKVEQAKEPTTGPILTTSFRR